MKKNCTRLGTAVLCTLSLLFFFHSVHAQTLVSFMGANGKFGFKTKAGKIVVSPKYDNVGDDEYGIGFFEGIIKVQLNGKWGYMDSTGKEIVQPKYQHVEPGFSEGFAGVRQDNKWGFVDKKGKEVVPPKYESIYDGFREGMAAVKLNGKWGFVDKNGKEAVPVKYEEVNNFHDGLASVRLNGKWGLLDKTGKDVVPIKYEKIGSFNEGLAGVLFNGKWDFVDRTGKEIIAPQYEDIRRGFTKGRARVKKDGQLIDIDNPLLNPTTRSQQSTSNPETTTNAVQVKLATPPVALKGKIDPTIIGLWKYTSPDGKTTSYSKFNADGTYEYYLGTMTIANKNKTPCYWRVDGAFMESVCEGANKTERNALQKSYDASGKPILTLGWASYVPADNKTSW
jgi:hypothetical protein